MRPVLAGIAFLGLVHAASAQGLPAADPKVKLDLTVEQVHLIVQALPLLDCAKLSQWATCRAAEKLVEDLKQQVLAQQPK